MKLIAEYTENNLEVLTEADEKGNKKYAIEGIFMQAEQKNRNGRIYPKVVMEGALNKYNTEQGLRLIPHLREHFTTQTDGNRAAPDPDVLVRRFSFRRTFIRVSSPGKVPRLSSN